MLQICFVIKYTDRWRDACVFLPKIFSCMRIPDGDLPICNVCHLLLASIPGESIRHFKHWKFTRLVQWIVKVESKLHGAVGCKMSPLIGDMGHMLLPWNPRAPTFISCRRILLVFFCYLLFFLSHFFSYLFFVSIYVIYYSLSLFNFIYSLVFLLVYSLFLPFLLLLFICFFLSYINVSLYYCLNKISN